MSEPGLQPDEVRIAVSYCGICGSDLHLRDIPAIPAGIVLGHEFTGVICETGPAVTGWKAGDRVTANPFDPCGTCGSCTTGYPELCPTNTQRGVGLVSYYGAYAGTVVVVGIPTHPSTVHVTEIATKEVTIKGSLAYTSADWREALDSLAAGQIPAADLITTVAPLEDAEQWFGELTSGSTRQIKVLLKP